MFVGESLEGTDLVQHFLLVEEVRSSPNGDLGAQVHSRHSASQDDLLDAFPGEGWPRPQELDGDALVLRIFDMFTFPDAAHDEPPLREEEFRFQLGVLAVRGERESVDAVGGDGKIRVIERLVYQGEDALRNSDINQGEEESTGLGEDPIEVGLAGQPIAP